jgi:hypothetical protein
VHKDFGVRAGPELVPESPELLPKFLMVVDLSVQNNPYATSFIRHRLRAAADVHDAQSPVQQQPGPGPVFRYGAGTPEYSDTSSAVDGEHTFSVGPSMSESRQERTGERMRPLNPTRMPQTGYPTHVFKRLR